MDQSSQNMFWSITQTHLAYLNFNAIIFWVSWTIYYKIHIFFSKKSVDNFWDRAWNMLIFN